MILNNIKYILFDLDGTITDPYEGITKSVQYSLKKFDIDVNDRSVLKPFIGPPLKYAYMTYYGMNENDALKAVEYYREFYPVHGIFDCTLYDGIAGLLSDLSKEYRLILATSKPQLFAEQIIEKFNLGSYFYKIVGATFDEKVSEKADVIKKILSDFSINPNEALMVGDRAYDTDGAFANGMLSIGVTYGYGNKEEFSNAFAIANNVDELAMLLKKAVR